MKQLPFTDRSSKQAGFTLVELLVVMGIIAILAGVLLSVAGSALRAANRVKAANLATQIQTACTSYYTEYSTYPVPTGTPAATDYFIADTGSAAAWGSLIVSLSGNIDPHTGTGNQTPTTPNTRSIAFLSLKPTDVDVTDAPLNPIPYSTGNPYFNLGIDNDYSGIVGDTGTGGMPNFTTSTLGSIQPYAGGKGIAAGIIVWANCNTSATATTWNPAYFVHTY